MTETIFAFDERNYLNCQSAFRGVRNQEYYLGDYSIEAGSVIDVRADKKAVGACSIIRLRSKSRLFFRRALSHIREDATDVTVIWFVKRGRLGITHQSGTTLAKPGDMLISKSMTPFFVECQTDESSVHDVLHIVVPTHVLGSFLPHEVRTGFCMSAAGRELTIAERIFTDIYEDTGELSEHSSQLLVDSALSLLSDAIKLRLSDGPARETVADKRLKDAFRFIELHLSDPKLSISAVAKGCGISARYLSFLLKLHGTGFSKLIWSKRLEMASRWLLQSRPMDVSIAQIAYGVGFKSPFHFSRMFKRVYKMSPRQYRIAGLPDPSQARHDELAGSSIPLQIDTRQLQ